MSFIRKCLLTFICVVMCYALPALLFICVSRIKTQFIWITSFFGTRVNVYNKNFLGFFFQKRNFLILLQRKKIYYLPFSLNMIANPISTWTSSEENLIYRFSPASRISIIDVFSGLNGLQESKIFSSVDAPDKYKFTILTCLLDTIRIS